MKKVWEVPNNSRRIVPLTVNSGKVVPLTTGEEPPQSEWLKSRMKRD